MTLDDLRVFVACCEAGNLSQVAREHSRSQPAVSQHVRRLERELGVTLLERRPRGVIPTQAGRILHEAARQGILHIDQAVRQVNDLCHGDGGTIKIATGATTVRHFMADGVVDFRSRHPKINLEFRTENSSRGCCNALTADEAELAWVTIAEPVRGVQQRPVVELPWVLAVRADDPLAGHRSIGPADLAKIRHIQLPEHSASRAYLQDQLARHGAQLTTTTSVADWDTAILLAELGLGHAIVPDMPGRPYAGHGALRLIPIPMLPPLTAGWAARQWHALSPLAREFADTVTDSLKLSASGISSTA